MVHSILGKESNSLRNQLTNNVNFVDFDYDGESTFLRADKTWKRPLVCYDAKAILNAYRMWLQSHKGDYIRQPDFGGLCDSCFNDVAAFTKDNETVVRDTILGATAEQWPALEVLKCEVKCMYPQRYWHVTISVMEKGTKLIDTSDNAIPLPDPPAGLDR
jgi:hypothetical protein